MTSSLRVADMIVELANALLSELQIPGEVTEAILTFAIDIQREDWYPEDVLRALVAEPERASFCRTTTARLFKLFGSEAIELEYEFAPSKAVVDKEQVAARVIDMARDIRVAVRGNKREVYQIKYSNHEFVVLIRSRRAEILQSFQAHYGAGRGLEIARALEDGELERWLARIASGGELAGRAQREAFGCLLTGPSDIFAYKKTALVSDDEIVKRLREQMRVSLMYYKELVERYHGRNVTVRVARRCDDECVPAQAG